MLLVGGTIIGASVLASRPVPVLLHEVRSFVLTAMADPPASLGGAIVNGPYVYTILVILIVLISGYGIGAAALAVARLFRHVLPRPPKPCRGTIATNSKCSRPSPARCSTTT
jgi:hypothetical protein